MGYDLQQILVAKDKLEQLLKNVENIEGLECCADLLVGLHVAQLKAQLKDKLENITTQSCVAIEKGNTNLLHIIQELEPFAHAEQEFIENIQLLKQGVGDLVNIVPAVKEEFRNISCDNPERIQPTFSMVSAALVKAVIKNERDLEDNQYILLSIIKKLKEGSYEGHEQLINSNHLQLIKTYYVRDIFLMIIAVLQPVPDFNLPYIKSLEDQVLEHYREYLADNIDLPEKISQVSNLTKQLIQVAIAYDENFQQASPCVTAYTDKQDLIVEDLLAVAQAAEITELLKVIDEQRKQRLKIIAQHLERLLDLPIIDSTSDRAENLSASDSGARVGKKRLYSEMRGGSSSTMPATLFAPPRSGDDAEPPQKMLKQTQVLSTVYMFTKLIQWMRTGDIKRMRLLTKKAPLYEPKFIHAALRKIEQLCQCMQGEAKVTKEPDLRGICNVFETKLFNKFAEGLALEVFKEYKVFRGLYNKLHGCIKIGRVIDTDLCKNQLLDTVENLYHTYLRYKGIPLPNGFDEAETAPADHDAPIYVYYR